MIKFFLIKIFKKIVIGILFIVALLPIGAYLALQYPALQTWVAKRATLTLSSKLNAEVTIGKVYYLFFNKLILNDINVINNQKDTILNCKKISISFSAKDLLSRKLRFRKINLYDGVFNLEIERDSISNIQKIFKSSKDKAPRDSTSPPLDLIANEIGLRNFRFTYKNLISKATPLGEGFVNFSDISLTELNIDIKKVRLDKDTMLANINNISFLEKSGFNIYSMNAKLKLSANEARLNDLYIYDGSTELKAKHFSLYYRSLKDFKEYLSKVVMEIDLDNAFLNFVTLSKIAPTLINNKLAFYASGVISGTVTNLKTQGLKLTSESGVTSLDLNARISGLPKTQETMAFVDINKCSTTSPDIAQIISSINSRQPIRILTKLSPLVKYSFTGRLAGLFTDFVANGNITSNIGNIYLDVLLRQNREMRGLDLQGKLRCDNFNVGFLLNNKNIGEVTLSSTMNALLRDETLGGSKFFVDSISIKKLEFNGYPFRNIYSVGSYVNNIFDGKIICHDPNLDFIFQGVFGRSTKKDSYYDFYANVAYADLAALKLDNRDSVSAISFKTLANFTQSPKGDIVGNINIKALDYKNSNGDYSIGDISILSLSNQNNFNISLKSSFANATYNGNDFFTNFIDKVLFTTVYKHTPALINQDNFVKYADAPKKYKFDIIFSDTRAISELVLPGFFISNKSSLTINVNENNLLEMQLKAGRIGFRQNYSNNLLINLLSTQKIMTSEINSDRIRVSGIDMDSSKINIVVNNNIVNLKTSFSNKGEMKNLLQFSSDIFLSKVLGKSSPLLDIHINPSILVLNNQQWSFSNSNIKIQDSTYLINNFKLFNSDQELLINGAISANSNDVLSLYVKNLDISPINLFTKKKFDFGGYFSGTAKLIDTYKNPQLLLNLTGEKVAMAGKAIGQLELLSEWNNEKKHFDISVKNHLDGRSPFYITGNYRPKDGSLDFKGSFSNMNVSYFEPFLSDIISKSNGGLSGDLQITGPIDKLILTGTNAVLNKLEFTVNFTNVHYTLYGPVLLSEKGLRVNNATISDRFGNIGHVNGGLLYNYFRELRFNTVIDFTNLECLNTTESDNPSFYGGAFGTGSVNISGPLDKILMDISATTNRNTEIHIPLPSTSEATNSDLLSFVQAPQKNFFDQDGYIGNIVEKVKKKSTELEVKLKININPEAAMLIEIDKSVGDVITGYGTGLVSLDINPSKDIFSIQGDYIINRGFYKFVLQGLFNRDFTIQQGGNIGFNGDILKTNLNLTANYRTKAAINPLISDTSSVGNRRTVDCLIRMSGALMNPKLSFEIDIPDLDPITKSRVDAALNTEDKVVKQVMSILVSGSFIPDIQSSIVNNSTILYSNATEILSNQINNIFNQLDIPLDLSFNYQPGQNGRDIFDAAVSTQLFGNRVVVNGNIGNSKYLNKAGSVVGDLDVEIKLDEKGRFRAKAFSHSADQFSNFLDNSQRSGLGLVYQEEFSSFRELFNSIFMSKKRRLLKQKEREAKLKGMMELKPIPDIPEVKPLLQLSPR